MRLKPCQSVTLHVERLTYSSRVKHTILSSLDAKRLSLDSIRGPEVVAKEMFSLLGNFNSSSLNSVDWILNVNSRESWEKLSLAKKKIIVGPNIEFEKPYIREKLKQFNGFTVLVPSAWVIPIIQERLNWFNGKFSILPTGIDFEYWKPSKNRKEGPILIYRKFDHSERDFLNIVSICNSMGLKFKVVTYGKYTRASFRRALRKCRAAIWLGTSESQGIALLECWAMDIPTLVRSQELFVDRVTGKVFASSAAPYLDRECGEEFSAANLNFNTISKFLNDSITKSPRDYVLSEFSPRKILEQLFFILAK
jgi:hypothetical protein